MICERHYIANKTQIDKMLEHKSAYISNNGEKFSYMPVILKNNEDIKYYIRYSGTYYIIIVNISYYISYDCKHYSFQIIINKYYFTYYFYIYIII